MKINLFDIIIFLWACSSYIFSIKHPETLLSSCCIGHIYKPYQFYHALSGINLIFIIIVSSIMHELRQFFLSFNTLDVLAYFYRDRQRRLQTLFHGLCRMSHQHLYSNMRLTSSPYSDSDINIQELIECHLLG